ncbi:MAG: hypothetical protein ACO23H_20350 [Alphaproteobacteria bacterium]
MNIYEEDGKRVQSLPEWVNRLVEENKRLRERIRELEEVEKCVEYARYLNREKDE